MHGRQTYVITYTLENVTWNFPDTGLEFYWDVNGVDWAQPFGSVTGRLHVPAELADRLTGTTTCYQGPHGATTRCDAIGSDDEPGGVVVTARASSLTPYQTLTMAVGFAPGTFQMFDASYLASPFGWLQGLVGIGAVGVGVWGLRRRRAVKDAPGRPTLIAEYEPPTTVDALESAVLLGRQSKAIPAEVLEQAVVGSIRIVEGEPGFWGKKPLVAELVDPSRADGDGRLLLQGLFPHGTPGETYTFGRQDTRFSQVAQSIVSAADKELTARGMRRTVPPGTRLWPIAAAVVAVMLAFALAMAAIGRSVHPGIPLAVLGVCGVVVFVVVGSLARRPLSARGAENPGSSARARVVHRVGGSGSHPHAAVAAGRRAGADRRERPAPEAGAVREAPAVRGRLRPGEGVVEAAERPLFGRRRERPVLVRRHRLVRRLVVRFDGRVAVSRGIRLIVHVGRIGRRRVGRWRWRWRRWWRRLTRMPRDEAPTTS